MCMSTISTQARTNLELITHQVNALCKGLRAIKRSIWHRKIKD